VQQRFQQQKIQTCLSKIVPRNNSAKQIKHVSPTDTADFFETDVTDFFEKDCSIISLQEVLIKCVFTFYSIIVPVRHKQAWTVE